MLFLPYAEALGMLRSGSCGRPAESLFVQRKARDLVHVFILTNLCCALPPTGSKDPIVVFRTDSMRSHPLR